MQTSQELQTTFPAPAPAAAKPVMERLAQAMQALDEAQDGVITARKKATAARAALPIPPELEQPLRAVDGLLWPQDVSGLWTISELDVIATHWKYRGRFVSTAGLEDVSRRFTPAHEYTTKFSEMWIPVREAEVKLEDAAMFALATIIEAQNAVGEDGKNAQAIQAAASHPVINLYRH